jgi:hypothetical protein
VAPSVKEYVPASQSLHAPTPAETLYVPGTHCVHASPAGPQEPALQVQFVLVELPSGEWENQLVRQSMHSDGPVKSLYLPAMHGAHVGPEYPALHLQAVGAALPVGALAFPGHSTHVESDVAPTVAEYFRASQLMHGSDPAESLYFPATHAMHSCPLVPG